MMCFDDPVFGDDEAMCPACLVPHKVVDHIKGVPVVTCPFAPAGWLTLFPGQH